LIHINFRALQLSNNSFTAQRSKPLVQTARFTRRAPMIAIGILRDKEESAAFHPGMH